MRLVLLISLFAAAVSADPITVTQARSASGLTNLFYSYDVSSFPGPIMATISGSATCNGIVCDQPATASIDLTMDMYTSGPVRDGIALLQLTLSSDGSAAGATQIGGSIGQYSIGNCAKGLDCQTFGYFPVELGVPFTIHLRGLANGPAPLGDAEFSGFASLQLYEVPPQGIGQVGAPVQILLAPEPGAAGFTVTGLSALILFAFCRRRNLRSL